MNLQTCSTCGRPVSANHRGYVREHYNLAGPCPGGGEQSVEADPEAARANRDALVAYALAADVDQAREACVMAEMLALRLKEMGR